MVDSDELSPEAEKLSDIDVSQQYDDEGFVEDADDQTVAPAVTVMSAQQAASGMGLTLHALFLKKTSCQLMKIDDHSFADLSLGIFMFFNRQR